MDSKGVWRLRLEVNDTVYSRVLESRNWNHRKDENAEVFPRRKKRSEFSGSLKQEQTPHV